MSGYCTCLVKNCCKIEFVHYKCCFDSRCAVLQLERMDEKCAELEDQLLKEQSRTLGVLA